MISLDSLSVGWVPVEMHQLLVGASSLLVNHLDLNFVN